MNRSGAYDEAKRSSAVDKCTTDMLNNGASSSKTSVPGDETRELVSAPAAAGSSMPSETECPICMEECSNPKMLPCSHKFCKECLDQVVKTSKSHLCPTCRTPFRTAEGKQPKGGTMKTYRSNYSLPGYEPDGTITIHYSIPSGIQGVSSLY